ncbi:hypothetical protein [Arthrobacter burdickii]|uniref:Uncharacterized protein n=1 Tax=Arthrobacter burdickii TaxID=3035920 RepID=A0ABT8K210_9MICC|nr:hypothetical protein [Arthrobacter burdickii]MDN4611478.1 hypothetical protein [Arthrobacter burdickii]
MVRLKRGTGENLSFEASIDVNTTLSIWGYEKNYSYELCRTRRTAGEPFKESIRVTAKDKANGIDFSGLFKAARAQSSNVIRERAFNAVIDYLTNPTKVNPRTNEVVHPENEGERWDDLQAMSFSGQFTYSQDEEILALVKNLTAEGSILWTLTTSDGEGEFFSAYVGDSDEDGCHNLYLSLEVAETTTRVNGKVTYNFEIQNDPNFLVRTVIKPTNKQSQKSWQLASEIHSILAKQVRNDEEAFKKIISDDIVNDVLASLDEPHK